MKRGFPIVISAASGTGKTSLCRRLLETLSNVTRSISFTTRAPRGDEVDGRDYHFVSRQEFERMIAAGELLEHAEVFGHLYGTGFKGIERQLAEGHDVLLDIDVQGGAQIKERIPDALMVFLLPPSMDELRRRLINRGTDAPAVVERRLAEARSEIARATCYDVLLVNDDFEKAAADLRAIVVAARLMRRRPEALVQALLAS